jgi:2-dehydropantoate 2-reductase
MKILVIGAGAVGGYFGGRLLQAGRDVTFLVRTRRAVQLAKSGLSIKSPDGDAALPPPKTVTAETLDQHFDLILLTCKAYDLEGAILSLAPAVGPGTVILPLLNGIRHLDILDKHFGVEKVLGGQCVISASLSPQGTIIHSLPLHSITFGERQGGITHRVRLILSALEGAIFEVKESDQILLEMWEKWVFLASLAGSTTLMRAAIGDICGEPDGRNFVLDLIEECRRIAASEGYGPRPVIVETIRAQLTATSSPLTASMYRDMERNTRIEADHIIGDLLQRGRQHLITDEDFPLLRLIYANLKAYERKQSRTGAADMQAVETPCYNA